MKAPCEADEVIKLLNGRWFAKKKVSTLNHPSEKDFLPCLWIILSKKLVTFKI
jgi:hypothetical protein